MGALDEGQFNVGLENGVKLGFCEPGLEADLDTVAIEDAVKILLQGLGEDVDREGLRKTPLRVAKAFREGTRGYKQKVRDIVQGALFTEAGLDCGPGHGGGAGGLVIVRDLDLFSYCESCSLPFQIKCHVGYVPCGQRVLGLSKLSWVADAFGKRLQEPQRLANEVCSVLHSGIKPAGVAIILECSHIHFPTLESLHVNSSHEGWVKILVPSGSGVFENKQADAWGDFLSLLKFKGIQAEKACMGTCPMNFWCPSMCLSSARIFSTVGPTNPEMVATVASIIKCLGEDPLRKELVGTPARFVKWLMKFKNYNLEMSLHGLVNGNINDYTTKVDYSGEQMHLELDLSFWSQCEHHLLPFHGVVHIGYFCSDGFNSVGKSILQSVVNFHGFKLQLQERLTRQIAQTASRLLGGDVMVAVEANHTCMISRGIEKVGSSTAAMAVLDRFSTDPAARMMFLQSIPNYTSSEL